MTDNVPGLGRHDSGRVRQSDGQEGGRHRCAAAQEMRLICDRFDRPDALALSDRLRLIDSDVIGSLKPDEFFNLGPLHNLSKAIN